jgi:peptidoglycan/xylan/chitin deacetylase (PgdA/CDA1 family)
MRTLVRSALSSRWLTPLWSWSTRGYVCIFTYHRFTSARNESGRTGTDLLARTLSRLRRDGFRFVALEELLSDPGDGDSRRVVFTVDDGYADFQSAADVFLDHECAATVFLPTAFIDGDDWLWWDKIEHVCRQAPAGSYEPVIDGPAVVLAPGDGEERAIEARRVAAVCADLPHETRLGFIEELASMTGVDLPRRAPRRYAPLSWDEVRRLEKAGIHFAPHTVTHPVLSRVDDEQVSWEIAESWRRVREELDHPSPILAYPSGSPSDFGDREARIASECGLLAAVTTRPGCAALPISDLAGGAFRLPRFPEPPDPDGATLAASGFYSLRRRFASGA